MPVSFKMCRHHVDGLHTASLASCISATFLGRYSCICNSALAMILMFGSNLSRITQDTAAALFQQPQNLSALLPSCGSVNGDLAKFWSSVAARDLGGAAGPLGRPTHMLDRRLEDVGATAVHVLRPCKRKLKMKMFASAGVDLSTPAAVQHPACCMNPAWVPLVPVVDKGARCGHAC